MSARGIRLVVFIVVSLILIAGMPEVAADDGHIVTKEVTEICHLDKVTCTVLQPGHFLNEQTYTKLDIEMRRLQDQETRLKAQNDSLRSSANDVPWLPIALSLGAGLILGTYLGTKF